MVAQDGLITLDRGYGLADIAGDIPATSSTHFDYFSIGKHITAAILLRLAERAVLNLDAPAERYLPEGDFEGAEVTVRQLLSHTSGLWEAEKDENDLPASFAAPPTKGAILAWANQGERLAPPGEHWMYSNGGYLFAGEIAERISGKSFEELVADELAVPLGLAHFGHCKTMETRLAKGYAVETGEARPIAYVDAGWWGGSGSVCGTAGDLMRWWLALRSGAVLSTSYLAQMFEPSQLRRGHNHANFGYGLGVRLGQFWGHTKIGHTGSGSGGTSVLAEYPDAGLAIVVVVNTAGDDVLRAADIEAAIAGELLNADVSAVTANPTPSGLLASAPGRYRSPWDEFCVTARGKDLWRSIDGNDAEQLHHSANGRFISVRKDFGMSTEYFLGSQSGKAQWFGYDDNGFPQDLAIRIADTCD